MTAFTDYARNITGSVVHLADCRTLRGYGSDWLLAQGWSPERLAEELKKYPWIRACKTCKPTEPRPTDGVGP